MFSLKFHSWELSWYVWMYIWLYTCQRCCFFNAIINIEFFVIPVCTRQLPSRFLLYTHHASLPMTIPDIGMYVHDLFFSFMPVLMSMNLYVPCRLSVGPNATHGIVRNFMPLVGVGSSCTSTYSLRSSLQCFLESILTPVMISREEWTAKIPVSHAGIAFLQRTMKYTSSMITQREH